MLRTLMVNLLVWMALCTGLTPAYSDEMQELIHSDLRLPWIRSGTSIEHVSCDRDWILLYDQDATQIVLSRFSDVAPVSQNTVKSSICVWAIGILQDLNKDKIPEYFAVCTEGGGDKARRFVTIFDGKTAKDLTKIEAREECRDFATTVTSITGGSGALLIASPFRARGSKTSPGRIDKYDPITGHLLLTITGSSNGDGFGCDIMAMGRAAGEDVSILVGAPGARDSSKLKSGHVAVISGRDLKVVVNVEAEDLQSLPVRRLGESVCSIPDVNEDGIPDIAASGLIAISATASSTAGSEGVLVFLSGRTGALIRMVKLPRRAFYGERIVDALVVWPSGRNNGEWELAVGDRDAERDGGSFGAVFCYSFSRASIVAMRYGSYNGEEYGRELFIVNETSKDTSLLGVVGPRVPELLSKK